MRNWILLKLAAFLARQTSFTWDDDLVEQFRAIVEKYDAGNGVTDKGSGEPD